MAEEMRSIREPNVFIVDDVAFIHPDHGMAIADEIERRKIRKRDYLETRCDVLIRNQEVFNRWAKLGLNYMFLGLESLDADQFKLFRKRTTPNQNFEALGGCPEAGDPGGDQPHYRSIVDGRAISPGTRSGRHWCQRWCI